MMKISVRMPMTVTWQLQLQLCVFRMDFKELSLLFEFSIWAVKAQCLFRTMETSPNTVPENSEGFLYAKMSYTAAHIRDSSFCADGRSAEEM